MFLEPGSISPSSLTGMTGQAGYCNRRRSAGVEVDEVGNGNTETSGVDLTFRSSDGNREWMEFWKTLEPVIEEEVGGNLHLRFARMGGEPADLLHANFHEGVRKFNNPTPVLSSSAPAGLHICHVS